jgi:hypothetical protein
MATTWPQFGPATPQRLDVGGRGLVVVRQGDGYVFAVARHAQAALSLHHTPNGIFAVAYSRAQQGAAGRVREALGG